MGATNETSGIKPGKTLQSRLRRAILWLYVISLLISLPAVYFLSQQQVYAEANKELSLLVDMVKSIREYIAKDVRPTMLEKGIFHPPVVSSTVATGRVAAHFRKKQPAYYIKVASDNPLNPANRPEPLETELLKTYRGNPGVKTLVDTGQINGRPYLVSSRASTAKAACLRCHGDPALAPKEITGPYGTDSGFGWEVGKIVGVTVVGVPLADINELVLTRSLIVAGILTLLFTLITITISQLVKRNVIKPLVHITEAAVAVSKGKIDQPLDVSRDGSEVGELGHAFEMLRRSLVAAMKRLKASR